MTTGPTEEKDDKSHAVEDSSACSKDKRVCMEVGNEETEREKKVVEAEEKDTKTEEKSIEAKDMDTGAESTEAEETEDKDERRRNLPQDGIPIAVVIGIANGVIRAIMMAMTETCNPMNNLFVSFIFENDILTFISGRTVLSNVGMYLMEYIGRGWIELELWAGELKN